MHTHLLTTHHHMTAPHTHTHTLLSPSSLTHSHTHIYTHIRVLIVVITPSNNKALIINMFGCRSVYLALVYGSWGERVCMCASVRCGTRGRRFDDFEICCVCACVCLCEGVSAPMYGAMMSPSQSTFAYDKASFVV